jgi:phosphatidylglycerophosphate synthase
MIAVIDCASQAPPASLGLGRLSSLEWLVRDRIRAGAERVIVRGRDLPPLQPLSVPVEIVAPDAPLPDGAEVVPGDQVLGIRVVDAASRRRARRAMLENCRRPYDGIVDRYVIRPLSLRITGLLAHTPVRPTQVTVVSILVGLLGAGCAATGRLALGSLLLFLQVVLDSVDGELARLRFQHSRFGMNLDNVGDELVDNCFIAAAGIGMGGAWASFAIVAASLRLLITAGLYAAFIRAGRDPDPIAFHPWFDRDTSTAYYHKLTPGVLLRSPTRRDFYSVAWALAGVLGAGWIVVVMGAALGIGYGIILFIHFVVKGKGV